MRRATASGAEQGPANCPASPRPARRGASRGGLTLVEMMVSVTITLLVVFAIVQVFDMMGNTVAMGRATMEMAGQLRSVSQLLQQDLDHLTCPVRPWIDPNAGLGYFEYVEGVNPAVSTDVPQSDSDSDGNGTADVEEDQNGDGVPGDLAHRGDRDDKLFFTVRSMGEPFTGRFTYYTNGGVTEPAPYRDDGTLKPGLTAVKITIKSNLAEVAWWVHDGALHRRVLLVLPSLNGSMPPGASDSLPPGLVSGVTSANFSDFTPAYVQSFYRDCDLSVRMVTDSAGHTIGLVANTMGDLTTPRNRFAHYAANLGLPAVIDTESPYPPSAFPDAWTYPLDVRNLNPNDNSNGRCFILGGERLGEDVAMTDVLAFDVRAYDRDARIYRVNGVPFNPSDPGYGPAEAAYAAGGGSVDLVGVGSFVDLGYGTTSGLLSIFAEGPDNDHPVPNGPDPPPLVTYDTWTLHYERDGINQDDNVDSAGNQLIDQGFNGLDDVDVGLIKQINGIDDIDERETRPPYDVPLRGIEVRIRQIEVSTGQVRQVSVVGDFTD